MRACARHPRPCSPLRVRAFTLIELLVVIAVIAVLISITIPALAQARKTAEQVRETSALRQHGMAYTVYASDNRGALMPGFTPLEWVTPGLDPAHEVKVFYSDGGQARLYGSHARRYPWRLAPYLGFSRDALVIDKSIRREFLELPDRPDTRDGFQWAYAYSPSFGINSTWVGGDARRGGFHQPSITRWGKYYVTTIDGPALPEKLLIFGTSRGPHPISNSGVVPGHHRVEGPWVASSVIAQVPTFSPWDAPPGPFIRSRSPDDYGHLDFRHFGKAVVVAFDGHVSPVSIDDLRDMRRWANQATSANWHP